LSVGRLVPVGLRVFYFMEAGLLAARNYVPEAYHGRVVLLRTKKTTESSWFDWSCLVTGELEIYEMPGQHLDVIQGPYVKTWAEQLRACLENA
jgi:hypothetical protein